MTRILYLTFDGLLEPLGRSQIVPYLLRLGEGGFRYVVVSLERQADLAGEAAFAEIKERLAAAGIEWRPLPYRAVGPTRVLRNCWSLWKAARAEVRKGGVELVHARAHVPAAVAWMLLRSAGVPYLFDMRGYWVDECAADGRWFTNRPAYAAGKRVERRLLKDAAGVTTLTGILADDLRQGPLRGSDKPIVVIPTSADYDVFSPGEPGQALPAEVRQRLRGRLVVGWVGAINASYCVAESLELFRRVLELRPDAHLLALTAQRDEMARRLAVHKLPASAYTLTTVPHQDMAHWLRAMDWAVLFLNAGPAKRGSVPTKLAEFLATGVRVAHHGCNEEVTRHVADSGVGLVLRDLSAGELERAAQHMATAPRAAAAVLQARERTRPHFGLEAAVERYRAVLLKLLGDQPA